MLQSVMNMGYSTLRPAQSGGAAQQTPTSTFGKTLHEAAQRGTVAWQAESTIELEKRVSAPTLGFDSVNIFSSGPPGTMPLPPGPLTGAPPETVSLPPGPLTGAPPETVSLPPGPLTGAPPETVSLPPGPLAGAPPETLSSITDFSTIQGSGFQEALMWLEEGQGIIEGGLRPAEVTPLAEARRLMQKWEGSYQAIDPGILWKSIA